MSPISDSSRLTILDTTLRDGEQAPGCHLKPAQKILIARQLEQLGVDVIEAGFPVSSPGDFDAVRQISETVGRERRAPVICAFGRSLEKDVDACVRALQPARRRRIHLFIATSDLHLKFKLRMTREQALEQAVRAVRLARRYTDDVQFACEDASRSDRTYLARFLEAVIRAGVTTVNIPDTVGYATPEEFGDLIRTLREKVTSIEKTVISVHCHDDLGMAVANSLAAVRAGARQVECTINGIGERAGNCSLEEIVMALKTRADFYAQRTGIRAKELFKTSRLVSRLTRMPVSPNKAIVGSNAFAHASGIHQDGMLKNRQTYEIMRPEDIGADPSTLVLTARSGKGAIEDRVKKLGFKVEAGRWPSLYARFKTVADTCRYVTDADLQKMVNAV